MSVTVKPDGSAECKCGACCQPKDKNRFLKRHPALCSERRAFAKQLAQGTRSVDTHLPPGRPSSLKGPDEAETVSWWIENIRVVSTRLTDWERGFIDSVAEQWNLTGFVSLKQKIVLERIYIDRT